jgi:hypothetical protein
MNPASFSNFFLIAAVATGMLVIVQQFMIAVAVTFAHFRLKSVLCVPENAEEIKKITKRLDEGAESVSDAIAEVIKLIEKDNKRMQAAEKEELEKLMRAQFRRRVMSRVQDRMQDGARLA